MIARPLLFIAAAFAFPAAATAQDQEPAGQEQQATPQAATMSDLTSGTPVRGVNGEVVGTIEAADAEGATITNGTLRLRLPLNNFQKDGDALRIGATKEQFEAAAQGATPS